MRIGILSGIKKPLRHEKVATKYFMQFRHFVVELRNVSDKRPNDKELIFIQSNKRFIQEIKWLKC